MGHFYCPNCGTATGPPHACDFVDIFMGELDEKVVERLEDKGVENTGWTIYRDDAWLVALNGLEDVPVIEDILQNLHPNIEWEINPRGPSIQPLVNPDGSLLDRTTLEHLDLTIHFVDNQLETDIFAKDVPIYVSTKSCHPPQVFKSVAKSVGIRLRINCSLDRFLSPRIEEYTRYLVASNYDRVEVEKTMEECKGMDRKELIRKSRRNRRNAGPKKIVFTSKWDPRGPNVHEAMKSFQRCLYMDKENEKAFPPGTLMNGFRRQKNVGEIIAPSKPIRVAKQQPAGGRGCYPCNAPRSCNLHQSGALQLVNSIKSSYDGVVHKIYKHLECTTPNVIYHIRCPCASGNYVGSTTDMKARWSQHKSDMRHGNWTACGLTRHFGQCHRHNMEETIAKLEVTLLDSCEVEENLKRVEDKWMCNLGTLFIGGLNTRNEVVNNSRKNFGRS